MKAQILVSILALAFLPRLIVGQPLPPQNLRPIGAPGLTAPLQSQTAVVGESVTFTASVSGDSPLSYQWTFNGQSVGSNSGSYTHSNCQLTDNGARVRVTVSNDKGSIESDVATLTVNPAGPVYYVSPNGSSGNSGTSTSSPWNLDYAVTQLGPGVTLELMSGIYDRSSLGRVRISNVSGTADHPAVVRAMTKWGAIIANSSSYGIGLSTSPLVQYLVIDGLCVRNSAEDGFDFGGSHCTIRNCWITGNRLQGINSSDPVCSDNTYEYNLIENNGTIGDIHYHGMYVSGPNNIIRGNVIRNNNQGYGIIIYSGYNSDWLNNNHVYNNLIYGHHTEYGLSIWSANNANGTPVGTNYAYCNTILDGIKCFKETACITNNILGTGGESGLPITVSGSPTVRADYNMSTTSLGFGSHNVVASSFGFVNASKGLYWLQPGSAARGAALSSVRGAMDFFDGPQSSWKDIGAFQYSDSLATDSRSLDPSPSDPDYWSQP